MVVIIECWYNVVTPSKGGGEGGGRTSYNGLNGEAPPVRRTILRVQVNNRKGSYNTRYMKR